MSEPINDTAEKQDTPAEKTFTQAEVDALIGKRVAKALKGVPSDEELTAFRAWKDSQQTEQERWNNLTKERDSAQTALTAAQAELEQYRREKYLTGKGVPADDLDYYAYKIGKLVTDETTFEKAAEEFLKEKNLNTVRVDTGGSLSGGKPAQTPNETMNSLFRGLKK